MPLKHSYSTWGVSSVGQSRGLIILWSSVQVTHALPIQTRVCSYENSSKPFSLSDDVRADVRRFSKSMPPWAGFCARWRCRPAGRHFSFCWYFCWYFSGKQAVYRGRCGSIHGIERVFYVTSGSMACSSCTSCRQPDGPPAARWRAGQRQLEAALRGYRLGYRATGYRRQNVAFGVYQAVNRRLLTASFDAYRLAYRALRTSSMLAYAGPKLKFSEVAGSRARVRR